MTVQLKRRSQRGVLSAVAAGLAIAFAACGERVTDPGAGGSCASATAREVALAPLEATVLRDDDASCLRVRDAGSYVLAAMLVNPQADAGRYSVQVGTPGPPLSALPGTLRREWGGAAPSDRLHAFLRQWEHAPRNTPPPSAMGALLRRELPVEGAISPFTVLASIDGPPAFAPVNARAAFVGERVLVYVDTAAPPAMSDEDWRVLGRLIDRDLEPAATAAFGHPTDVDGNGRVIMLFTPVVNALVTELECATLGYINGFFFANDLSGPAPGSNQGEIFYAYVPDPAGRFSCPHRVEEVRATLPPTFIHEFQHMISYGAHVVTRGGEPEHLWLNEGLSHVAEDLGARVFDERYPPPSGRSAPGRLYPDSAVAFRFQNLANAYAWLSFPSGNSMTVLEDDSPGTLPERGASWLFLHWLEAQKGGGILRGLVHTHRTGADNVAAVAGEPFGPLFEDFAIAVTLDSVPGQPRATAPARFRFGTRALRREMLELNQLNPARAPNQFALAPITAGSGIRRVIGLPAGGIAWFSWDASAGEILTYARPDNSGLPATLRPALAIVRLP